jgi:hypothetical protein
VRRGQEELRADHAPRGEHPAVSEWLLNLLFLAKMFTKYFIEVAPQRICRPSLPRRCGRRLCNRRVERRCGVCWSS